MKKIIIIKSFLMCLFSMPVLADANNTIGSGTIVFSGKIVNGTCLTEYAGATLKSNCWNGSKMEETQYKLNPNKPFADNLKYNNDRITIDWIRDNAAIVKIAYN